MRKILSIFMMLCWTTYTAYGVDPGGTVDTYYPAELNCVNVSQYRKCARLPVGNYSHLASDDPRYATITSGTALDDTHWTHIRNGVLITGSAENITITERKMGTITRYTTDADCVVTKPFFTRFYVSTVSANTPNSGAKACLNASATTLSLTPLETPVFDASALNGDKCPDGFFTVPYESWCGDGMINIADTPNCADDTSGEFCLMLPTVPCDLGISNLKTSTGLSIPLFAEKYTSPAIHIGYNGGICYADLTVGQEINAININFNGTVYHTTVASGDSGGDDTGGDSGEEEVFNDYKFTAITTSDTTSFSFNISAAGTFYIDWGDGTTETITKTNTANTPYSHTYATAGIYNIKLGGLATGYSFADEGTAAISFGDNASLGGIDGCLGCIFPTLSDGTQPSFNGTFSGTQITSIPENLFAGINGAPASYMFNHTFRGTPITSIPEPLFAGINGSPASYMFYQTFYNTKITSIPDGLFAGINGAPANGMFNGTFRNTPITSIPSGLFAGINGAPARYMFDSTFYNTKITSIPEDLFAGIDTTAPLQEGSFKGTFHECTSLTGPSARINGQYLYEIWPDATSAQVNNMYSGAKSLTDYKCIPSAWGGAGSKTCGDYPFIATTTSDTSEFSLNINSAGTFYINWGDGTTETITKTNTENTTYSHTYATAGTYDIGISGLATGYDGSVSTAAISFDDNASLAAIDGCLGCIFPTLSNGTQPRFYHTFSGTQITSIPDDLFAGINGAPTLYMFYFTFYDTPITSIPENLFAGIKGAPALAMFYGTFKQTNVTSIPAGLFAGISGAPASYMFDSTFYYTPITSIPDGLFAGINGAPATYMFNSTFRDTDITSIPENLFAGIKGAPASYMFGSTFRNTPITSIPENLFAGTNGAPASYMFKDTFGYTGLTSIPENLFAGIKGAPASSMFSSTFYNTPITSIPENLFAGIKGAPAGEMFDSTFYNTDITSIPENLFAGINGAPASSMFSSTFYGTPITSIPENLFAGINGAPASYMFDSTFFNTKITSIPDGLFAGINGVPAGSMFASTFYNTDITSIPENLFAGIDTTAPLNSGSFDSTFYGCSALTGPSARINGQYLYEIWPNATSAQVGDMYHNATGLTDYANIPDVWK